MNRTRFTSIRQAERQLQEGFFLGPSELNWGASRPQEEGWLLAFNCDVIGELDLPTPPALRRLDRLGRNGFVRWSRLPAPSRASLDRRLPPAGRSPIALAYCPEDSSAVGKEDLGYERRRHIPVAVSRAVWQRDASACQLCGTTEGRFHLDHKVPWSKGGKTTVENLQVLCASCNLSKGAKT